MKAPYVMPVALVLLGISESTLATSLPGAGPAGPGDTAPGIILVQNAEPDTLLRDRMRRLRQHRTLLESALQLPGPAEPPEPQVRALQVPVPVTDPTDAQAQISCDAAAEVVADYGFADVRPANCSGDLYRFSATRDGTDYSIGITAASGEIAEVARQ